MSSGSTPRARHPARCAPRRVSAGLAEGLRARRSPRDDGARAAAAPAGEDPTASTTVRDPAGRRSARRRFAVALDLPGAVARARDRRPRLRARAGRASRSRRRCPDARVDLVESAVRHCRYLERGRRGRGVGNVTVVNARAEAWPEGLGAHDVVTARALAALPVLCEYAAPLLRRGRVLWSPGRAPSTTGRRPTAPRRRRSWASRRSRSALGRRPFAGARDHTLHVFRKVAPTPPRFPRRPGIATKRPLSATS